MQFIRSSQTQANNDVLARLRDELSSGKHVLWLLSGGSNIQSSAGIQNALPDELTTNLTIGLIDERYGPVGHSDSNWAGLQAAGINWKQAKTIPVLVEGLDQQQTADAYQQAIEEAIAEADITIGQLGMGDDGHTAGILPNSPAAEQIDAVVVSYESQPFKRITLGFKALKKIDVGYLLAFGSNKIPQLQRLAADDIELKVQPVQIIKAIHEAYVYNDEIEETV